MPSTYILLKDLPDSKAGDRYVWVDVGVHPVAYYKNGDISDSWWLRHSVENNVQWFKKQENVIERIEWEWGDNENNKKYFLKAIFVKHIDTEKKKAIFEAIEQIVNEEMETVRINYPVVGTVYTEQDLRQSFISGAVSVATKHTFEDYIKSINK